MKTITCGSNQCLGDTNGSTILIKDDGRTIRHEERMGKNGLVAQGLWVRRSLLKVVRSLVSNATQDVVATNLQVQRSQTKSHELKCEVMRRTHSFSLTSATFADEVA